MIWNIIIWLVIGALVGWLASKFIKTKMKLLGYIVVGIIGSLLGGFLFGLLGINFNGLIGSIFTSLIGAIIVLVIYGKIRK